MAGCAFVWCTCNAWVMLNTSNIRWSNVCSRNWVLDNDDDNDNTQLFALARFGRDSVKAAVFVISFQLHISSICFSIMYTNSHTLCAYAVKWLSALLSLNRSSRPLLGRNFHCSLFSNYTFLSKTNAICQQKYICIASAKRITKNGKTSCMWSCAWLKLLLLCKIRVIENMIAHTQWPDQHIR